MTESQKSYHLQFLVPAGGFEEVSPQAQNTDPWVGPVLIPGKDTWIRVVESPGDVNITGFNVSALFYREKTEGSWPILRQKPGDERPTVCRPKDLLVRIGSLDDESYRLAMTALDTVWLHPRQTMAEQRSRSRPFTDQTSQQNFRTNTLRSNVQPSFTQGLYSDQSDVLVRSPPSDAPCRQFYGNCNAHDNLSGLSSTSFSVPRRRVTTTIVNARARRGIMKAKPTFDSISLKKSIQSYRSGPVTAKPVGFSDSIATEPDAGTPAESPFSLNFDVTAFVYEMTHTSLYEILYTSGHDAALREWQTSRSAGHM
jgi:hypothetical protein